MSPAACTDCLARTWLIAIPISFMISNESRSPYATPSKIARAK